ncbi:MAG TPA: glycosyltransferase family 39 protein [Patescibacteria group bacterium]|nr:glycosyltransferase family 39 protein [Patescibacteria group bacterium]
MKSQISNLKSQITNILFLVVVLIVIAAGLRLWEVGQVPPSPDWDEAALGYNAYSLLHTGRDEYGQFLPVVLRSFDDYKPALYSYLIIPFLFLFGLSIQAVRMPSIFFGITTVVVVFLLAEHLFNNKKLSFLIALLLAISPWHIQFSRIGFESNVGLAFNIFGIFFFLKGLKKPYLLFLSVFSFCASIYVYQSEKVFSPLMLFMLIVIFHKQLFQVSKKHLITAILLGILFILPMGLYLITNPNALARAKGVSVFSDNSQIASTTLRIGVDMKNHDYLGYVVDNRRLVFVKDIAANYLSHYDLKWLFITGDVSRHHAPFMGLLYFWELPFLIAGIYYFIFSKYDKKTKLLILGWFLLAPLPASVTTGVPHAVRTLNFLPTWQIFIAFGLFGFYKFMEQKNKWLQYGFIACVSIAAIFNFAYFVDQYFVQQNYYNSLDWQYGYEQAVSYVSSLGAKEVVVTNQPPLDQSYIFFLFYLKYDPFLYQSQTKDVSGGFREDHVFGRYVFRPIEWNIEKKNSQTIYVGRPEDFPSNIHVLKTIFYLDGKPAIEIVRGE